MKPDNKKGKKKLIRRVQEEEKEREAEEQERQAEAILAARERADLGWRRGEGYGMVAVAVLEADGRMYEVDNWPEIVRKKHVKAQDREEGASVGPLACTIARRLDSRLDKRYSFQEKGFVFNCVVAGGSVFLCASKLNELPQRVCFEFLESLRTEYEEGKYLDELNTSKYTKFIRSQMEIYSHPDQVDKVAGLQQKVDEVKDVGVKNLEKLMEREERLEEVLEQAQDLNEKAKLLSIKTELEKKKAKKKRLFVTIAIIACCVCCLIITLVLAVAFIFIFADIGLNNNN
jgi:hypothetical protein